MNKDTIDTYMRAKRVLEEALEIPKAKNSGYHTAASGPVDKILIDSIHLHSDTRNTMEKLEPGIRKWIGTQAPEIRSALSMYIFGEEKTLLAACKRVAPKNYTDINAKATRALKSLK